MLALLLSCILRTCSISINYPYDATGQTDGRPGTWGTAGFDDGRIIFSPPAGYRVRVLRAHGNFTARMHGKVEDGQYAGALFSLARSSVGASDKATLAAEGCFIYLQADVGTQAAHVEFDTRIKDGWLDGDNVLVVRRAVYLNETGRSLHSEPSFVVDFRWVPIPSSAGIARR